MDPDYIIVGAGSAGSVIARRLVDRGQRVLLLEAGGSDRHPFVAIPGFANNAVASRRLNWMFEVEPDASRQGRSDVWPAGRALGGGSAINGMMYIRGHPRDYDQWAALGCEGWDYASLLPCFRRLEDNPRGADQYRGVGGPQSVSETREHSALMDRWISAVEQAGVRRNPDLNGESPDGVGAVQATQKAGWRMTAGSAFVRPLLGKPNFELKLKCRATRIQLQDGRATGVEYERRGRCHVRTAAKGVIVSCGAMMSPVLLMRSGIGPRDELLAHGIDCLVDLPGVGANLQDHPAVIASYNVRHPTFGSRTGPLLNLWHGINFLLRGRGPLTTSIGHAHAFIRTDARLDLPDVQIITSPFAYDFDERGARLVRDQAFGIAIGVMRPGARGRIRLRSADASDPPRIEHQLLGDDADVRTLVDGVRFVRDVMRQPAIADIVVSERFPGSGIEDDAQLESFVRSVCFSMYHQVGTCKMGVDDQAVVDPRLAVRGVKGLFVADASVMPTLPSGNTNATALMIGERASDLVLEQAD